MSQPNGILTPGELRTWDRNLVWHAFTQMADYEPLIIDSGRGCVLVDIDEREYLEVIAAAREQVSCIVLLN